MEGFLSERTRRADAIHRHASELARRKGGGKIQKGEGTLTVRRKKFAEARQAGRDSRTRRQTGQDVFSEDRLRGRTTHSEQLSHRVGRSRMYCAKRWIDSGLDDFAHHDFAHKGFCSSPACVLIVVAARPIGITGSIFLSRIFLSAFLKNQEADRKIRDRKMQAMSLKPLRSPGFFVALHEWRRGDLAKSWRAKS